ncbi:NAD(P)-binding protein, partial [Aureobasidium melanogenum]
MSYEISDPISDSKNKASRSHRPPGTVTVLDLERPTIRQEWWSITNDRWNELRAEAVGENKTKAQTASATLRKLKGKPGCSANVIPEEEVDSQEVSAAFEERVATIEGQFYDLDHTVTGLYQTLEYEFLDVLMDDSGSSVSYSAVNFMNPLSNPTINPSKLPKVYDNRQIRLNTKVDYLPLLCVSSCLCFVSFAALVALTAFRTLEIVSPNSRRRTTYTDQSPHKMSMTLEEAQAPRQPKPVPSGPDNVLEQFNLRDRVVVVTGAAEGIGGAVVDSMAEAGANVALWYRSNDKAIAKAEELAKKHGNKFKAYQIEISDPEKVKELVAKVVEDFGRLDVMVANAGMAISKPILETSVEEYKKQFAVNVDGVFYCAKYAGEQFKKQGKGNLIITSSISAHIVNVPVDQPVYNSTKAAITHLGKSLAREWRDFARVNIVSPGFFNTKMGAGESVINEAYRMTPMGRQGDVREIKALYLYLASDASSYQTGSDTVIDGGYILP